MSATDYRRIIELAHPDEWVAVECSDGMHINLTVYGSGAAQLDHADLDTLIAALIGARLTLTDR